MLTINYDVLQFLNRVMSNQLSLLLLLLLFSQVVLVCVLCFTSVFYMHNGKVGTAESHH